MTRPDDIPADIWDAADALATRVRDAYLDDDDLVLGRPREIAARALIAERERCAAVATGEITTLLGAEFADTITGYVAAAIRKGAQ